MRGRYDRSNLIRIDFNEIASLSYVEYRNDGWENRTNGVIAKTRNELKQSPNCGKKRLPHSPKVEYRNDGLYFFSTLNSKPETICDIGRKNDDAISENTPMRLLR